MNDLKLLSLMVGPDKALAELERFLFRTESGSYNGDECCLKIIFFDLDNVLFRTNEILTTQWLPKTIWRCFLNRRDVDTVDVDRFFYHPEEIGIPRMLVWIFRLSISMSISRLTRAMVKMKKNNEQITTVGVVEAISMARRSGIDVIFLTNRPRGMWKETKKQISLVFGNDDEIVLCMRHGYKKRDVIHELSYCSVGLVDDQLSNLTGLPSGKMGIFLCSNSEKCSLPIPIKRASNGYEISNILCRCRFGYDFTEYPTLISRDE